MKNNKGFTLAEILGVVVIISLLALIALTSFSEIFSTTKNKISEINKKNLVEAGKTFGVLIYNCEISSKNYEMLGLEGESCTCQNAKETLKNGVDINVSDLKELELFIDNVDVCEGTIKIKDINNNITVELLDDVTCK